MTRWSLSRRRCIAGRTGRGFLIILGQTGFLCLSRLRVRSVTFRHILSFRLVPWKIRVAKKIWQNAFCAFGKALGHLMIEAECSNAGLCFINFRSKGKFKQADVKIMMQKEIESILTDDICVRTFIWDRFFFSYREHVAFRNTDSNYALKDEPDQTGPDRWSSVRGTKLLVRISQISGWSSCAAAPSSAPRTETESGRNDCDVTTRSWIGWSVGHVW